MGLFSKKKKEKELPDLPKKEFPTYEAQAVPELKRPLALPLRRPELPLTEMKPSRIIEEEKPLFVKIEKYKAAVSTIEAIRSKLENAEKILRNLNKIRLEEEEELENWQRDISTIKDKLLSVYKNLFGV